MGDDGLDRPLGEPPFEVVGPVSPETTADLFRVADDLARHPWGGPTLQLLLSGDLLELLRSYMPRWRFAEWEQGYRGGRITRTGAINFIAADGRRAAAVPSVPERATFLMLVGHEIVEAALERRFALQRSHRSREPTHTALAHVLWTEYVVERTRRQVFNRLGLGHSPLDNGLVSKQVEQLGKELPKLIQWALARGQIPGRVSQHWAELARIYAMSLGRADEGSPDDLADLAAFRRNDLVVESAAGWDALDESLRRVYDQPTADAYGLDQLVLTHGWMKLFREGLGELWDRRYAVAAGR